MGLWVLCSITVRTVQQYCSSDSLGSLVVARQWQGSETITSVPGEGNVGPQNEATFQ